MTCHLLPKFCSFQWKQSWFSGLCSTSNPWICPSPTKKNIFKEFRRRYPPWKVCMRSKSMTAWGFFKPTLWQKNYLLLEDIMSLKLMHSIQIRLHFSLCGFWQCLPKSCLGFCHFSEARLMVFLAVWKSSANKRAKVLAADLRWRRR